jgi:hypothetical protein
MVRTLESAVLLVVVASVSMSAIVVRHDVADERYRTLGEKFPAVSNFGRAGEGTLVGDMWVITAAHVAAGMRRDVQIRFADESYGVDRIVTHPEWKEMGAHDIALVKLSRSVTGVSPLPLYPGQDESGKQVVFVGHGGTGTGMTGPQRPEDGLKRGATNIVDSADADWLFFRFDAPPAATELEGISGPGDSGGPALIEIDGTHHVAGISVWGKPGPKGRGTYGATEGYTRVSRHAPWLRGVMARP